MKKPKENIDIDLIFDKLVEKFIEDCENVECSRYQFETNLRSASRRISERANF